MATATMGLRRRVPVNNSPIPSSQSPSASGNSTAASNKRSRSENNNSPSHGNLNSMNRDEPPTKKSRGTSTSGSKNSSSSTATSSSTASLSPSTASSTSSASPSSSSSSPSSSVSAGISSPTSPSQLTKGRGSGSRSTGQQTKNSSTSTSVSGSDMPPGGNNVLSSSWPASTSSMSSDVSSYASVTGLSMASGQNAAAAAALCAGTLNMPTPIPYMSSSMATFVGNATNLGKSSAVSYLDISNMTSGSLSSTATGSLASGYGPGNKSAPATGIELKPGSQMPFTGISPNGTGAYAVQNGQSQSNGPDSLGLPKKFLNDGMFNAYQPWVIKTYGDLAKTKTITIKKYARILRTLRGEEVNSAENSKFRFWVKSKGFHIGQPEGYDAKPADRIIGRHAVTSPGLDPPLYVPTQLPHNKALNGAEGTVPPGRVYKKVAIVENFFDIIHAVHVDLEGRPGKHAGQKRTYRTITETYAFLPREAVTRFLLGCTECQRRPRTPSPTNLSNQSQSVSSNSTAATTTATTTTTTATSTSSSTSSSVSSGSTSTRLSPSPNGAALTASPVQSSPKSRGEGSQEGKSLYSYRHQKHQKGAVATATPTVTTPSKAEKEREKEEKYNPLSISNLLKKEPVGAGAFLSGSETLAEFRRTPESDRASSKSSASSKRKRMLPEGRTPSPQPTQPLPRPWSPGLDPKNTPIDYSLPITTSYLKHQQRLLQAEKNKAKESEESYYERKLPITPSVEEAESAERERFSPAAGLIDTNLNLLATIQHLHCQVMLALTERLKPSISMPGPLVLPSATNLLAGGMMISSEVSVQTGENRS